MTTNAPTTNAPTTNAPTTEQPTSSPTVKGPTMVTAGIRYTGSATAVVVQVDPAAPTDPGPTEAPSSAPEEQEEPLPLRLNLHQANAIVRQVMTELADEFKLTPSYWGKYGFDMACQLARSMCFLESHWGGAWKPPGVESRNWGAVQHSRPLADGTCPVGSFLYRDSTPQADGTNKGYAICFRSYPSHLEGARDAIRTMYFRRSRQTAVLDPLVRAVNGSGEGNVSAAVRACSVGLYDTVYYQGTGPDRATRIDRHFQAMLSLTHRFARELGEWLGGRQALPPTQRKSSYNQSATLLLQERLNHVGLIVKMDGIFGDGTEEAVMRFQGSRGLKVDGVVGSRTWQELLKQVAAGESKGAASRPKPEPEQPPEPTKDDAVEVLLGSDDIEVLRKAWEVIGRILPEGEE